MGFIRRSVVSLGTWLMLSGAGVAGECGYDRCWGAVGIGPDGAYGWSHGAASEAAAWDTAQDGCGGDCDRIQTFHNTCGAMAEDAGGAWGWGIGDTQHSAEVTALQYCAGYGGTQCVIRAWACSR